MSFNCINKKDAKNLMNQKECLIVDIRDSRSFDDGHIDGAINLQSDNIDSFISSTDKNMNVIVCCYHGNSSKSAAKYLVDEGFVNVFSLDGGYEMWKNNIN